MRKILLATTALVGFVGAAQAAESPVAVTMGGYVDFRAAVFGESAKVVDEQRSSDFSNEFQMNIDAAGKAGTVQYGAHVGLWNGERSAGSTVSERDAYIWISGNYGKILMGDTHSADVDLFVAAPYVGGGQVFGKFTDFVASYTAPITPIYTNDDDNSSRITYYTPKFGNENHKVQVGLSYTPNFGSMGHQVVRTEADISGNGHYDYKNVIGLGAQYTGKFDPITVVVSPVMTMGEGFEQGGLELRDYTTMGVGAQVSYNKATIGGSYLDAGHINTESNQTKTQSVWTLGAKYAFDQVDVAANYLNLRGYRAGFSNSYGDNYGRVLQEYGVGAAYKWFPGMTTSADVVLSVGKGDLTGTADPERDVSRVFMISQKMVF